MDKKLLKSFAKSIERWAKNGKGCSDQYLVLAYEGDAKDLREVHDLIEAGDYQKAARVAFGLDTIVREQIPGKVWDFLQRRSP